MPTKLFVSNFPFSTSDEDLKDFVEDMGYVTKSVKIIFDRDTDRSKGFGFIELADASDFDRALADLNGSDLGGRKLKVAEATSKDSPKYANTGKR